MNQKFIRKNKVFLLFFCGFLIGICLEVIFVENGVQNLIPFKEYGKEIINITCLVLIKHQHLRYVNSSKKTWLKRCNNYYIVNIKRPFKKIIPKTSTDSLNAEKFRSLVKNYSVCSENDDIKDLLAKSAWGGLCKVLHFMKLNHMNWLIITSDSSVVVVENLKLFVQNLKSDESHYYGHTLKNYEADYNVLSAGILLSRGAVKQLLEKFSTEEHCDGTGKYWNNEDLYLGKYLKQMNILPKDSRDEEGRGRFYGYNVNNILWPGKLFRQSDYTRKALYPVSSGFNGSSPFLITMDVSNPDSMQNLYFFLYKLKTSHTNIPPPAKLNKMRGTAWKDFLKKEGYISL